MSKQIREECKHEPVGPGVFPSFPDTEFDEEIARSNALLNRPPYDEINREWERKGKYANWYSLFGGPRSIRKLAYNVDKGFWYEFLYSDWSGRVHAGSTLRNVGINSKEPSRMGNAIRPLRHPEGIRIVHDVGGIALAGDVVPSPLRINGVR